MLTYALCAAALAASPTEPHPQRVLKQITSKPAAMSLSAADTATLTKGDPVVRSSKHDAGGRGQAVQYVNAPASVVWEVILDYDRYPQRVNNVESASVYKRSGADLYVDMQSSILGKGIVIYSRNPVRKDQGWMAWGLDYDRTSDVKDLTGYWLVEQVSDSPPVTRLDHATELAVSQKLPGFVVNYLTRQSLIDGTAWVKEHAEKVHEMRSSR